MTRLAVASSKQLTGGKRNSEFAQEGAPFVEIFK
jgi:hypothetical protein